MSASASSGSTPSRARLIDGIIPDGQTPRADDEIHRGHVGTYEQRLRNPRPSGDRHRHVDQRDDRRLGERHGRRVRDDADDRQPRGRRKRRRPRRSDALADSDPGGEVRVGKALVDHDIGVAKVDVVRRKGPAAQQPHAHHLEVILRDGTEHHDGTRLVRLRCPGPIAAVVLEDRVAEAPSFERQAVQAEREGERDARDADLFEARQGGWSRGHQDTDGQPPQRNADHGAAEREKRALSKKEPDDRRAPGPKRLPDRDLAATHLGSGKKQVGDVGARNQQDDTDRPQQDPECPLDLADFCFLQRDGERPHRLPVACQRQRKSRPGERLRQVVDDRVHVGPRISERHAIAQPRHRHVSEESESRGAGQRFGNPRADAAVWKRKRRRHDADDLH